MAFYSRSAMEKTTESRRKSGVHSVLIDYVWRFLRSFSFGFDAPKATLSQREQKKI
jgi:hypothetical protein